MRHNRAKQRANGAGEKSDLSSLISPHPVFYYKRLDQSKILQMKNVIIIPKTEKTADKSAIEPTTAQIRNNGFFPDILLADVRNAMRTDGTVTENRLKNAVIEAIATVNAELKPLQQRAKVAALADLEADSIDGESIVVLRYKRAVYCLATANLYERYRSYDSTKEGAEKAQEFEQSVDDLRRDARFAIRDLLNRHRWTVELI